MGKPVQGHRKKGNFSNKPAGAARDRNFKVETQYSGKAFRVESFGGFDKKRQKEWEVGNVCGSKG